MEANNKYIDRALESIKYNKPPVTEVVCGILHQPVENLLTPHIGLLWEKFREDYPDCQEVTPIAPSIEIIEGQPNVRVAYSDIPPLPRIWFKGNENKEIIQIQRDRFLFNWRKASNFDEYPGYKNIFSLFKQNLLKFESFLKEIELGKLKPIQYELSYVNQIIQGNGWTNIKDIDNIFPSLSLHKIPEPFSDFETINWNSSHLLPNKLGRLYIKINNALRGSDKIPILVFEINVRSFQPYDNDSSFMEEWFNFAHAYIIQAFNDMTSFEIKQNIWSIRQ